MEIIYNHNLKLKQKMKQLFVLYELALLAKDKGFDEPCFAIWSNKIEPIYKTNSSGLMLLKNSDLKAHAFTAPLYQQLADWFIEKHNIVIYPEYTDCCSSPIWAIKWHTNAYMERFVSTQNKALEEAFKLI